MNDLVPLFAVSMPFIMIMAVVLVPAWLKSRERRELQATLRSAIEKGQPLPPEVIETLTRSVKAPATSQSDLRTGVIWLAVGIGFGVFGAAVGYYESEAIHPLLGMAAIPAVIGVAFIVLSLFNPNKPRRA